MNVVDLDSPNAKVISVQEQEAINAIMKKLHAGIRSTFYEHVEITKMPSYGEHQNVQDLLQVD